MKYLLLYLLCTLCACQTHHQRHLLKRDSTQLELNETMHQRQHAFLNEARIQQVKQQSQLQTLVIFPIGTVSFHPDSGFRGEAKAILVQGEIEKHTIDQINRTSIRQESQVDANIHAHQVNQSTTERASMATHKPISGFSFRWLAIVLFLGCLLILVRWFWKKK